MSINQEPYNVFVNLVTDKDLPLLSSDDLQLHFLYGEAGPKAAIEKGLELKKKDEGKGEANLLVHHYVVDTSYSRFAVKQQAAIDSHDL